MVPMGYMAKRIRHKPEWLLAPKVTDIYSVSFCISESFADYVTFWKHNGFWFFDSPEIIRTVAEEHSIDLAGTSLFYYEAYEREYDGDTWHHYGPESSFPTNVTAPCGAMLAGFDVVTFMAGNSPECSPLSCNSLAGTMPTNHHCLFASFEEAKARVNDGGFNESEPGPYRIFAVYSAGRP
jgi:hypothetical protein